MAPARKKSVNKRFLNEVPHEKEVRNSNKNKERVIGKRRLFDKLGPRWSDGELQRFYKAYRVHGVDLKKIAAEVPNRSVEMVQTLYRMNKVYLSLPEGTASVVGLIAMMTDHYSTLEVSDGERESYDVLEMSRKPHKSKQTKSKPSMSKGDLLQSRSVASSDAYLSLLKKGHFYGDQPRAVGKRTPRIPIPREHVSMKKGQTSENDANEEEVAHVAALALTEGLRRGGSPQVSHISRRRTEDIKSSPIRSLDIQASKPKSSHNKLYDASIYGEWTEGDCRKGASNGAQARDVSTLKYMEGFGTVEVHQKGKKFYGNKVKAEEIWNCQSDDGGEACSGTEGSKVSGIKRKDIEESNGEIDKTSLPAQKSRSGNKISGDEVSVLDGLQVLANISAMESESSVQLNEERTSLNMDDKSNVPEATSTSHHKDKIKLLGRKEKARSAINEVEHTSSRKPKLGRHMEVNAKSVSEVKPHPQSIVNNSNSNNSTLKRKRQFMMPKVANGEGAINSHHGKPLKAEVEEEEIISALKVKRICQSSAVSKQVKAVGVSEGNGDEKGCASEVVKSTAEVPISSDVCLPMRKTSRRKIGLKRALLSKEGSSYENILKNQDNRYSIGVQGTPLLKLQEKLSCSLSSPMVRRWCTFEWFYSAIDYPWFAKREFVEYLNHVGLGHMPTLTRVEWGVIRSSLGKPRRFSENFLREEREKLKLYRDSVRNHYTELRTGIRDDGLPTDLAKPLKVGQRVIAVHPRTRELKDGSVLTVDHDCCRVQFDCPEMGVEFVKDIDCMPLDPLCSMPESLRRRRLPKSIISNEVQVNENSNIGGCTTSRHLENSQTPTIQQIAHSQPSAAAQLQAKEVDIQAVPELNRASDMKNSYALPNLRKPGTNSKTALPPWLKPAPNCSSSDMLKPAANCSSSGMLKPAANCISSSTFLSSRDSLGFKESESTVVEIVRGSKQRAQTMVDAAVQAISSIKEGEDPFMKIGEALESIDNRRSTLEPKVQVIRSPEEGSHNHPFISSSFESQVCEPKSHDNGDKIEPAIPSEIITSCVSTLLMIQTCTERQFPPADVAQIIDLAVTSLHPSCTQNLPIYREIQMCMGRIKTQILALVPT
ncbi:protein ALWAYS EARLY 2-like isoform X2 [Euphorbia lathyris]|uniref:protein ALWAYS EARLY 2-like isoform X2 n=1 Tax=Euphorbia lathyris TaxID=212925 RepID=UPI0033131269